MISRRKLLTNMSTLGSLLVTGCARETFVPPRPRGGLVGVADVLTMSTNRFLLSNQQLAREYQPSDVTDDLWNPFMLLLGDAADAVLEGGCASVCPPQQCHTGLVCCADWILCSSERHG